MLNKENIVFLLFSLVSVSLGLVSTYFLSNYLSVEDFGKVQFLLTMVGTFSIFYLSGFDVIIIKQLYDKNDNIVHYILKNIIIFSLILLLIVASIVYTFSDTNKEIVLYAAMIASVGMFDKTNAILNAKLKFKQFRYLEFYIKLILLFIVLITIIMKLKLETYLILFTVTSMVILIARILFSNQFLTPNSHLLVDYTEIKKEGFKTTLSVSYTTFASWSEKVILGILDVHSLAIFTIAQLFPKVIKDNIKVFLTPTLNTWSSKGFDYYKSMILKNQLFLWSIGIVMSVSIYFLVDFIISHFFIKYKESILVAQLLSMTLIFKFVELAKMSSMALSKHTNIFNKINNVSNTFKIILVGILIPMYGMYGAVFSILFVECLRFSLVTKEFNKLQKDKNQ